MIAVMLYLSALSIINRVDFGPVRKLINQRKTQQKFNKILSFGGLTGGFTPHFTVIKVVKISTLRTS
jgi:hypothetical protein